MVCKSQKTNLKISGAQRKQFEQLTVSNIAESIKEISNIIPSKFYYG